MTVHHVDQVRLDDLVGVVALKPCFSGNNDLVAERANVEKNGGRMVLEIQSGPVTLEGPAGLREGGFRPTLRVKLVKGTGRNSRIWELTWESADGRATFEYGEPIKPGEPHIIWRRIGTHDIFNVHRARTLAAHVMTMQGDDGALDVGPVRLTRVPPGLPRSRPTLPPGPGRRGWGLGVTPSG